MNRDTMLKIGGYFEELENIVRSSSVGSGTEPVWDGTLIGKNRKRPLVEMGLIEYCHGYWFPTKLGSALYAGFVTQHWVKVKRYDIDFGSGEALAAPPQKGEDNESD